jgi:hypothetical protein
MRYVVVDRRGQMQPDSDEDRIDTVLAELDERLRHASPGRESPARR